MICLHTLIPDLCVCVLCVTTRNLVFGLMVAWNSYLTLTLSIDMCWFDRPWFLVTKPFSYMFSVHANPGMVVGTISTKTPWCQFWMEQYVTQRNPWSCTKWDKITNSLDFDNFVWHSVLTERLWLYYDWIVPMSPGYWQLWYRINVPFTNEITIMRTHSFNLALPLCCNTFDFCS